MVQAPCERPTEVTTVDLTSTDHYHNSTLREHARSIARKTRSTLIEQVHPTMSTIGQFSSRNPTIKRILKEASELASQPSNDYHAAPLESDLFEWHFTLRGPPSPSPYEGGLYHGRIVLPPAYPLKPPSFRFLTPTGRFEVNREICLSISGHHEETWQPAWGIRTALVAIRSFMDSEAKGQLGGMDASEEARRRWATQSGGWWCGVCGKANEAGGEVKQVEAVPEELRLAYKDEMKAEGGEKEVEVGTAAAAPESAAASNGGEPAAQVQASTQQQQPVAPPTQPLPAQTQLENRRRQNEDVPPWIDKAIVGVVMALVYLLFRRFG